MMKVHVIFYWSPFSRINPNFQFPLPIGLQAAAEELEPEGLAAWTSRQLLPRTNLLSPVLAGPV